MLKRLVTIFFAGATVCNSFATAVDAQETTWQASAGFVFLNRDGGSDTPIATTTFPHVTIVDSSQLETGFHSGFNFELTKRLSNEYSINARHFNVDDWTEIHSTTSTNGAWLVDSIYGDDDIDNVVSTFDANLYSTEINLVHQFSDRVALLAGFRWLSIDENLHMEFTDGGAGVSEYEGYVKNDLYGFQAGANIILFDQGGPFSLDSSIKAGVYGNDARNELEYVGVPAGTVEDSAMDASFVGEIGITGTLFLSDRITLSAGYQLLWVEGVAKISEQLGVVDWGSNTGIAHDDGLFYHGAVVNLTFLSR